MERPTLGKAEWEILRYIAEKQPISVREVADYAAEHHGLARTTILTVMERLRQKGFLKRRKMEGVYQYSTKEPANDTIQGMIGRFVTETLQGTMSPFIAYMSESADVSDRELAELKKLVGELEKKRKRGT